MSIYDIDGNILDSGASTGRNVYAVNPFHTDDSQALLSTYDDVIAFFDALVTAYPDYVTKNTLSVTGHSNYEYVFTSGNYNSYASHTWAQEAPTVKPKIMVASGIHGDEKTSVMGNCVFFKELCEGASALQYLREAFEWRVVPIVNEYGYDNNVRANANGVDLNRNFDASWTTSSSPHYSGTGAASEKETQLIQNWIDANTDAVLFLDHHNSSTTNEIFFLQSTGKLEDVVQMKKSVMYCANHIIPHWKLDRGIAADSLFFYCNSATADHGMMSMYARDKGINSLLMETTWNVKGTGKHSNFSIGVAAEAQATCLLGACTCIA